MSCCCSVPYSPASSRKTEKSGFADGCGSLPVQHRPTQSMSVMTIFANNPQFPVSRPSRSYRLVAWLGSKVPSSKVSAECSFLTGCSGYAVQSIVRSAHGNPCSGPLQLCATRIRTVRVGVFPRTGVIRPGTLGAHITILTVSRKCERLAARQTTATDKGACGVQNCGVDRCSRGR